MTRDGGCASVLCERGARLWGIRAKGVAKAARGRPGRRCVSGARVRGDRAAEFAENPIPDKVRFSIVCTRIRERPACTFKLFEQPNKCD